MEKEKERKQLQGTPKRPPTLNLGFFGIVNTHDYILLVLVNVIYFIIFSIYKYFMNVESFKFLGKKSLFFTAFMRKTIYLIGQKEVRLK